MKWKLASLAVIASVSTHVHANECGTVTIADMNWNSASVIANIDQFVLKHGYGCDAQLTPGDTMPTATSMIEKGQPDIAPELWTNSVKDAIEKGVEEGRLAYAGNALVDGGEEGFWVPSYLVKQYPELATIEGVKKHAKLFKHPEDPSVSGFYGCPAGWGCQISGGHLFEALKLEEAGFELIDSGSSAGLSGSIAKAYERKEGWFGYYWAPTAVLGKYEMVKVDFGSGVDEEAFTSCIAVEGCENPTVSMYPPSPVNTVVVKDFANNNPQAMEYLAKRGFTNADMNKLLAWMEDEQASSEDTMYHFLETSPEIWKQWVSPEVAKKITANL
ncbi:ABC transporter substrate-binding protein [Vibrio sp. UCD-FRSSP16_10]|uniref:ABC transporter substrate-binding protein n=1 Tax=unclassified Vibrio TaxID=2614977 RepID=UPI0007FC9C33|nr:MULTISPECIES: ABC transporter substrate-binding protein [unclassified Vibrio]OBT16799.1 ABC transporter substrate-binding protein [Vibrio sp. UCD-FRSSP16_30]OBT21426.1 ABC transporter substrate-binding protein [Vibrio sp. UCD-FRSSP16_10]